MVDLSPKHLFDVRYSVPDRCAGDHHRRRWPSVEPPSGQLDPRPDVFERHRALTHETRSAGRPTVPSTRGPPFPCPISNRTRLRGRVSDRVDPGLLALLLAEPEGPNQGHRRSTRWVGAGDRSRPQPRDDSAADPSGRTASDTGGRCAVPPRQAHPLAVPADVLGNPWLPCPPCGCPSVRARRPDALVAGPRTCPAVRSAPW
jgi:hypothetical protein